MVAARYQWAARGVAAVALLVTGAFAGWWLRGVGATDSGPALKLETSARAALIAREARLAAATLAEENAALQGAAAEARREAARLMETLAAARAEADVLHARGLRAESDRVGGRIPAAAMAPGRVRVAEVSEELGLVVLDGGAAAGLRAGMTMQVLRGSNPVARIRLVDVRERISGAVIDEAGRAERPMKDDAAVPLGASGR